MFKPTHVALGASRESTFSTSLKITRGNHVHDPKVKKSTTFRVEPSLRQKALSDESPVKAYKRSGFNHGFSPVRDGFRNRHSISAPRGCPVEETEGSVSPQTHRHVEAHPLFHRQEKDNCPNPWCSRDKMYFVQLPTKESAEPTTSNNMPKNRRR